MIKFFRKIRQKLLVENRFNKYLIYAVGEIVLVVIGILIALQINNWNLERQDAKFERDILYDIKRSIENDLVGFEEQLQRVIRKDQAIDTILLVMNKKLVLTEKELTKYQNRVGLGNLLSYDKAAFETLKNRGLGVITSDSLKKSITRLYEVTFPKYHEFIEDHYQYYRPRIDAAFNGLKKIDFYEDYFKPSKDSTGFFVNRKFDFDKIYTQEYKDYLLIQANFKRDNWWRLLAVIRKTKVVLELINQEIQTRYESES